MEKKTSEKNTARKKQVSDEVQQEIPSNETSQKLTYEQLAEVANNLNQQCRQLYSTLQEAKRVIASFNEVKMITDLLDKAEFFSDGFVDRCVDRLESAVTTMFDNADLKQSDSSEG